MGRARGSVSASFSRSSGVRDTAITSREGVSSRAAPLIGRSMPSSLDPNCGRRALHDLCSSVRHPSCPESQVSRRPSTDAPRPAPQQSQAARSRSGQHCLEVRVDVAVDAGQRRPQSSVKPSTTRHPIASPAPKHPVRPPQRCATTLLCPRTRLAAGATVANHF